MSDEKKSPNLGNNEVGYKKPPKNRQFGQPEGNKMAHGFWKKEDTARYKLEQIVKMDADELQDVLFDPNYGEYEKNVARTILEMSELDAEKRWKLLEGMTNQVSGFPKQQVEQRNIEIKPILPKKEKK